MRGAALFVGGLLLGAALSGVVLAQNSTGPVRGVNHVGINVANYDQALAFYTKTLNIREAYTIRNADGSPRLTYLQLSRDTFIELIPATANQPKGLTHIGIEVDDIDSAVARFRQAGVTVADPGTTPAKARFTRMTDRDGVQLEVMQFGPDSLQRKAIDAWK
jgi:catechol 2,3-dioxygenase-like lactoylglutathione lyase family enzyme